MITQEAVYLLVIHQSWWQLLQGPSCNRAIFSHYPHMFFQFPAGRERICQTIEFVIIDRIKAHQSFQIWAAHHYRSNPVDDIFPLELGIRM